MASRPNLLFIMPDQLRHDFLSCYGADFIDTPHIDSLAQHGVRYQNAYSPAPICVPARSMLMTGRNPIKTGVLSNNYFLRPDEGACGIRSWPELLVEAGYATAAIGKMHFYPWDLDMGFEHRVVCEDKRWLVIDDDYQRHLAARGQRKFHGNEHEGYQENRGAIVSRYATQDTWDGFVGRAACEYIRDYDQDKPFAMMVGFPGPHCPYDPTEEYLRLFDPEDMPAPVPAAPDMPPDFRQGNINGNRSGWNGVDYSEFTLAHKKKIRAHYAALVKQIDDEIGTMLDALQESGRLENTIIVFCSDHGDYLGDHDLIGKGTFYESSTRVPLLVRMPGAEGGAVYDGVSSIEDITATLLHFGGVQIPGYCDSQPLPELGISGVTPRERIFGFLASGCMNFDGEWKLAKYASGVVQLFNLKEDPQEQHDRSADPMCMEVYRRLDAELTAQMLRSIQAAHGEKFVGSEAMWDNESFGREGWQRTYPHPISH